MDDAECIEVKLKQQHRWARHPAALNDDMKICRKCGVVRVAVHNNFLYATSASKHVFTRACPNCLEMAMRKALE